MARRGATTPGETRASSGRFLSGPATTRGTGISPRHCDAERGASGRRAPQAAADPRSAHLRRAWRRRNPARFGGRRGGGPTEWGRGGSTPSMGILSRREKKKTGGSKREKKINEGGKEKLDGRVVDLLRVDNQRLRACLLV